VDIIVGKVDGIGAFLIGAVAVIIVIFVVGTVVVIGAFHIGAVVIVIVVGAIVIIGAVLIRAVVIIVGVVIFVVIIVGMVVIIVGMRVIVIRALVGTITTIVVVVHNAFGSNKLVSIDKSGCNYSVPWRVLLRSSDGFDKSKGSLSKDYSYIERRDA
jgi:hypothetical protein